MAEPEGKKFELTPSISILLAGVIIAAAILFTNTHPAATGGDEFAGQANVPAPSAQDHIVGSPTAPVVLIEYSDFQCPYCNMAYPTLKRIVEESNGGVAWVHRNFPLGSIHPQARPAALAAECITEQLGNTGFWQFADAVYNHQDQMNPTYYAALAQQFGASKATFDSCVATEKFGSKVDTEYNDAIANGGQGTPFTIVYGKGKQIPVSGAVPYAQFMAVIKTLQ